MDTDGLWGYALTIGGTTKGAYMNQEGTEVRLELSCRIRPKDCRNGKLYTGADVYRLSGTNKLLCAIPLMTQTALGLFLCLWALFRKPRSITMWVDKTRKLDNKEPWCTYPLLGGGHQRVTFHPETLAFPPEPDMTSSWEQYQWAEAVPGKVVAWQNEPGWRAPDWAEASAFLKARRPFWREEQYFVLADAGQGGDVLWAQPAHDGSVTFHRWNVDRLSKHCKVLHNRGVLVDAVTLRVRTKSDQ